MLTTIVKLLGFFSFTKVELIKFVCDNVIRGLWEKNRQHKGNANTWK